LSTARFGLAVVFVVACKTQVAAVDAAPLPSASAPVVESPTPSASATHAVSAAFVACAHDTDCVALPSPCCDAWPSNLASREQVQKAIQSADGERCKTRMCAMRMWNAACDHGACVVR
jgi:hypothetical protein